jgi:hypothetical protein
LTEDDDDAEKATEYLKAFSLLGSKDPEVQNVSDHKGDNILYVMIQRKLDARTGLYEFGDTGYKPYVNMVGGTAAEGGAGLGDFSPNYSTGFTGQSTTDGCAPVISSAAMSEDDKGYIMNVNFSEPLKSSLSAASTTFTWLVGTEEIDYAAEGYVVNFRRVSDEQTIYTVETNMPVLYDTGSTLDYAGAGLLLDANDVSNTLAGDIVDVTPWENTGVGVEGEDETDVPDVFALSKNFPNPFNPSTTINYDIAGTGGHVSMVIYNMSGQKVRTLVDEVKAPGFYSVVWDGTDEFGMSVSSGIYLYKIISGDFNDIEKMTFVK